MFCNDFLLIAADERKEFLAYCGCVHQSLKLARPEADSRVVSLCNAVKHKELLVLACDLHNSQAANCEQREDKTTHSVVTWEPSARESLLPLEAVPMPWKV